MSESDIKQKGILSQLKEHAANLTHSGEVVLCMSRILKCSPYLISSKVIVNSEVRDGHLQESYVGRLSTSGEGLVLFEAPTKDLMFVYIDSRHDLNGVVKFESFTPNLYRWSGRIRGNELYLDRDRDTYCYSKMDEHQLSEVLNWLRKYCIVEEYKIN